MFTDTIEVAMFYTFQERVKLMKYQGVQNAMERGSLNFR